jgi:hypothetical protein
MQSQQRVFEAFQADFNDERPHQALGQVPPTRVYRPSGRPFPESLEAPTYPLHFETRYVHTKGEIDWRGRRIQVGGAFRGERVGLCEVDDGLWLIHFDDWELGLLNDRDLERGILPRLSS